MQAPQARMSKPQSDKEAIVITTQPDERTVGGKDEVQLTVPGRKALQPKDKVQSCDHNKSGVKDIPHLNGYRHGV
jgi:hypothetical protein